MSHDKQKMGEKHSTPQDRELAGEAGRKGGQPAQTGQPKQDMGKGGQAQGAQERGKSQDPSHKGGQR